jgi:VCBS repeat-containing protein
MLAFPGHIRRLILGKARRHGGQSAGVAAGNGRLAESLQPRTLLTASDFTVVALGDTQYLTESDPKGELPAITQWVANNATTDNIAFFSQQGDFLRRGYSNAQATNGAAALAALNGKVPYSVDIGNHDFDNQFDDLNDHISSANFTSWFGNSFYQNIPGGDDFGGASLDQRNHYQIVTPAGGGPQFMVLSLEWEAENSAIAWAQGVINAHRNLPVILTTHEYLNGTGRTTTPLDPAGNAGQAIFTKLVNVNPQIFLVLSGHTGMVYHQTSTDAAGLPVFEATAELAGDPNGGDSYIQSFDFSPGTNAINVTTYSPYLQQSLTGANYSFALPLNFSTRFAFATGAVANDDTFDTAPGQTIQGNVVANDFDSAGATLAATLGTGPTHGTLTLNANGSFTYVPVTGYAGNDTFTYTVNDGTNTSNVATVTLRMNTAPVAGNDTATTSEGQAVVVSVLSNDSDADKDALTPILTTLPAHGAVYANSNGTFAYTPDPKWTGTESFAYVVSDGKVLSAAATVSVTTLAAAPATIAYDYPIGETTTYGTRTGSYANLGAIDQNVETIAEVLRSGSTTLDQRWQFNVTGGSQVTVCVDGWHPTGTDEYNLTYSTNNSTWSNMTPIVPNSSLNITRYLCDAGEPYQMWLLPATTKGTIYIRATNDMTNSVIGSLAIDSMFICSTGVTPVVAPAAPSNLKATYTRSKKTATLTWTDNSSNETGFHVWISTDGANYSLYSTLAANVTSFTTSALAQGTWYFEVSSFNSGGESFSKSVSVFAS